MLHYRVFLNNGELEKNLKMATILWRVHFLESQFEVNCGFCDEYCFWFHL